MVGNNTISQWDYLGLTTLTCSEKASQLANLGQSLIRISGRLRDYCGAEIDVGRLEQAVNGLVNLNSRVALGAGAVGAADTIYKALPAGVEGIAIDRGRGSFMNPNSGRVVNNIGRGAGVIGGVASAASAYNSYADGDYVSGNRSAASTIATGAALLFPPTGTAIFVGSVIIESALAGYRSYANWGLDEQSQAICARDRDLLDAAYDQYNKLDGQQCCGQ
jgi:hypothetical protein